MVTIFDQFLSKVDDQAQLEARKSQVGEDLGLEDRVGGFDRKIFGYA
jgi:hypothetical protein